MKTDKELKSGSRRITRKEALKVLVGDKHAALKLFEDPAIYIFRAKK